MLVEWKSSVFSRVVFICVCEDEKTKVVILQTGSEDLKTLSEEEMVNVVVDIYKELYKKNVKFIWSNIESRGDDLDINTKGYFVNIKIGKVLKNLPGACVGRMDDLYLRNLLNSSIMDGNEKWGQ